jgi:hypothetical protein
MSTQTTYLGLNKPQMSDTPGVNIPQFATNFDTIDSVLMSASFIPSAYVLNLQGLTIGNCTLPPYNVQLGTITLG